MSKVTSKLQLTLPKTIADQYGIRPGDELEWIPAGESIRVELARGQIEAGQALSLEERLELFDQGNQRLDRIQKQHLKKAEPLEARRDRGWTREELYERGFPH